MDLVFFCGQMEENMRDNFKREKSMEKVYIIGVTKENIKEIGKMINRMDMGNITY